MESNLHNNYLFKAIDAYPYSLEETLEALNYALSYNNKNAFALFLMARVHAEQLHDYKTAKQYYAEALAEDMELHHIYPHYIQTLLWNNDIQEATNLIEYAFKVKGIDKAVLLLKKGQLYESIGNYKMAVKTLKEAKKGGLNNGFVEYTKNEISRVKNKLKPSKKKMKKKKKSVKRKN